MLIALCSDKGSPGTTTSALALATAWSSPAVVVEADPGGGDLGVRVRPRNNPLPPSPTVLTAAASARTTAEAGPLAAHHVHRLSNQVSVLPAPLLSEQMSGIGDWRPLARQLSLDPRPVLVDVGRLHASSPAMGVAAMADVVVAVARPDLLSVVRVRDRLNRLVHDVAQHRAGPPRFYPLLVTPARHGDGDVADLRAVLSETSAVPFLVGAGFIALDPTAVRQVFRGEDPSGRLRRTSLIRTARTVAAELQSIQDELVPSTAAVSGQVAP